jgi:predicted DCC family thiol-disulfide oxidoreductase YuxK
MNAHAAERDPSFDVEVFFDGECPLCRREVAFIDKLNRRGRVRLTDIAAPEFEPASVGRDMSALMARIHGRLPDGTLIEGVEVFRRVYSAIGLGALSSVSRLPGVSWLADRAYDAFARNRLHLTGRCTDETCAVD